MKRIIRTLFIATLLLAAASAFAQNERNDQRRNEWREKMKAEKIGFLTSEIGLTSEEAKLFWPVYEKIEAAREAAMERSFKAFHALERSLREEKGEAAIAEALNEYLAAGEELSTIDRQYVGEYRRILSSEKIARLYFAEEKFRRNQINRLGSNPPGSNRK